ncbi:conserved hypothetical protein [Beutenbergia cavernae DSM 12333]|uniref:TPR-repeat-containing protein n=1 Tax=Beutenbergia cavernae (strain ATCC BAA-8 / DSM 12333 / CCUG 43141 / JCM 11478 / NBRC 16432 / NCIMB 13614 / HKI 0122) TaxID=471853 RepID=C5BW09_BEUC1|nr:hypothetical protein [Beutenbergia cavernae]ACQ80610.1 conserved hypothetical protein [Beutenbergia cavernae DSM 12333]
MAGRLLDDDPERAYEHAQAAVRRAGRIDVVREAAALAAYATARYAEALRELRTVRRLSGIDAHRALEADSERGLGRPERAIALFTQSQDDLDVADRIELTIVASGARLDLGQPEAALALLDDLRVPGRLPDLALRVREARVDVLTALGRTDEAESERAALPAEPEDPIVVTDLEDDVLGEEAWDEGVLEEDASTPEPGADVGEDTDLDDDDDATAAPERVESSESTESTEQEPASTDDTTEEDHA